MTPLALAKQYLDIFFSGEDFERMYEILAEDLHFEGPFFQSGTAQAYVESLQADPPVGCSYKLLQAFEDGDVVNLLYRFSKPGVLAMMSQLFETENGRIKRILLVFDTGAFHR